MPLMDMQGESQGAMNSERPMMQKELPPPGQEGYAISIHITPEGFHVTGPDPLPTDQEAHDHVPDITTALKHVIAIVRENPISGDANDELKAGYESA